MSFQLQTWNQKQKARFLSNDFAGWHTIPTGKAARARGWAKYFASSLLLGCGRFRESLIQAALAAIGHVAVERAAFNSFIESGGTCAEFRFRHGCVAACEGCTELLLTGFYTGDDGGVAFTTFRALAGAFCC